MAVRFVIGRAGTGKTHYCLSAIRARLLENPVDGPRLVFLVPEQAALQMERALLRPIAGMPTGPTAGASWSAVHRADVLSFRRLAFRILDFVGGPVRTALTESARAMVIRHLLAQLSGRLRYFRGLAPGGGSWSRAGGVVERIAATISELIHEAIMPEQLRSAREGGKELEGTATALTGGAARYSDPARDALLHDLGLVYQAYLSYLGEVYLDPSQHLEAARAQVTRCPWLEGVDVWVDGFASLSGQESLLLLELARRAAHVDVTMLMDPARLRSGTASPSAGDLYARTGRTYVALARKMRETGLEMEEPLVLESVHRFRRNGTLGRLERVWGQMPSPPEASGSKAAVAQRVALVELPTRRLEVEYAVSRVMQWIGDPSTGYRYRDVALIVRDLEPYHDLLSQALRARNIPFFIDRRRPIAHHPLVELLRSAAALIASDMPLDVVRLFLKAGFLALEPDQIDTLENYLIANAIEGAEAWRGREWTYPARKCIPRESDERDAFDQRILDIANRARVVVWEALEPLFSFITPGSVRTGLEWSQALVNWLLHVRADGTLRRWSDDAERDGDLDQAEEHRQVWRDALSFLDDLGFALSEAPLSAAELVDVLEAGLAGLTLGLAPPTVDAVLVGAIERSRHPDIKAAVILGFNDGVFPARPREDSILGDDDRELLQERGLPIRGGTWERTGDEAMLLYIAVTRASDELVVTCAASDEHGRALAISPYAVALQASCPGLTLDKIEDPIRTRSTWDILHERDLVRRLTTEFRTRPPLTADDRPTRALWNTLYERHRGELIQRPWPALAMRALATNPRESLSPASVKRLYGGPLRSSVSQLEAYAACPFQHFARHVLRLNKRDDAVLDPVDVGRVHHAILEDFLATLIQRGQSLGALDERSLEDELESSFTRVRQNIAEGGPLSDARNAYLLRRVQSDLARILRGQRRVAAAGQAKPQRAELGFGFDDPGGLPALSIRTPKGRTVLLRGYIDRVDLVELADELLGVVIDYKRTPDKRLDLSRTYHGISTQLIAYLLALAASGETLAGRPIRPVAALFVSLVPRYELVNHPSEVEENAPSGAGVYRPRGLISIDDLGVLDSAGKEGRSAHYAAHRKKDGGISNIERSDAADPNTFRMVLEFTRRRLGELADAMLDGDVSVSPYRIGRVTPCSWCPMLAACRFEWGVSDIRFLEPFKRSEVFSKMREATKSGDHVTKDEARIAP